MEYKISEVKLFSAETYGRDGNHRAVVRFDGHDKEYSAFLEDRPSVGDIWNGEIKKTEKNDKIYWNFEFDKGRRTQHSVNEQSQSSATTAEIKNAITLGIMPKLDQIIAGIQKNEFLIKALGDRLERAMGKELEDNIESPF